MLSGSPHEREKGNRVITRLPGEPAVIDGPAVEARRRAGLQPSRAERQVAQAARQGVRRRLTGPSALVTGFAHVDPAGQKRAGCQHHAGSAETQARLCHDTPDNTAFNNQVVHGLLEQVQVVRLLKQGTYRSLVQAAVNLCPGGAHRGPLAGVEDAELYPAPVRRPGHDSAQGVDLLDQVAFADAPYGRVARHLAEGVDTVGQQQGLNSHARGSQGGLGAGMAATDDNDFVFLLSGAHISPGCENYS